MQNHTFDNDINPITYKDSDGVSWFEGPGLVSKKDNIGVVSSNYADSIACLIEFSPCADLSKYMKLVIPKVNAHKVMQVRQPEHEVMTPMKLVVVISIL